MSAKLFIGGLPPASSTADVKTYFEEFGTVADAVCMAGRGFGFVTYDSEETASQVCQLEHVMDGRRLDVKPATREGTMGAPQKGGKDSNGKHTPYAPGGYASFVPWNVTNPQAPQSKPGYNTSRGADTKIFVGGLPQDCEDDKLVAHFSQYGTLVDAVVMKDRATGIARGFGFVRFELPESADKVMADYSVHQIDGKHIDCKRATPPESSAGSPSYRGGPGPMVHMACGGIKGGSNDNIVAAWTGGKGYGGPTPYRPGGNGAPAYGAGGCGMAALWGGGQDAWGSSGEGYGAGASKGKGYAPY